MGWNIGNVTLLRQCRPARKAAPHGRIHSPRIHPARAEDAPSRGVAMAGKLQGAVGTMLVGTDAGACKKAELEKIKGPNGSDPGSPALRNARLRLLRM